MKKVTVVVPTKNSKNTLDKCLESIVNQTYENIELIVVDNFSEDDTVEISKKYTQKVFSKGPERSTQRNFGGYSGSGDYVVFIDSDMILTPTVIEDCVKEMKDDVAGIVIPETSFGGTFWAKCKGVERAFYVGDPYIEASRFFRKEDFEKVGGFDEELVGNEDWTIHNEMEKLGKIGRIKSYIHHNEGDLTLFKTTSKKSYYSNTFENYKRKYPEKAKYQFDAKYRIKLFFKGWKIGLKHPILYTGVFLMKFLEFAAYRLAPVKETNKVYK